MEWKDLKISKKLSVGFGSMLVLLVITGWVGFKGIQVVSQSLHIVGDEEAPLVDMAMEMKVSLMAARNAMEEFKGATNVLGSEDGDRLQEIEDRYLQAVQDFDAFASAILEGKAFEDGNVVIKTDNTELAETVSQSDQIHNEQFQPASKNMMDAGRKLLEKKVQADLAIASIAMVLQDVETGSNALKKTIVDSLQNQNTSGSNVTHSQSSLQDSIALLDLADTIKFILAETNLDLEQLSKTKTAEECDTIEQNYREKITEFDRCVQTILNGGEIDGTTLAGTENTQIRDAVEQLDQKHETFQEQAKIVIATHRAILTATQEVDEAMTQLDAAGEQADQKLSQVEELVSSEMTDAKTKGAESSRLASIVMVAVIGFAFGIGILLGVVITRGITKPLEQAVHLAKTIAAGDLSHELDIKQADEIGVLADAMNLMVRNLREVGEILSRIAAGDLTQTVNQTGDLADAVNQMVTQLNEIMANIQNSSEQLASNSEELTSSAQNLSSAATEQASSLEETSAAIEELASSVNQNADNAKHADEMSQQSALEAEEGGKEVAKTVEAMKKIATQIAIVDDIADQTNLLALNAAIEAARAGEMGKGFAVVAVEVRKLAERSQQAAREISELALSSVERAEMAGKVIQQVVPAIKKTAILVAEITAACQEQSLATNQIRDTMTTLDQVTQQNSSISEETAAASEELSAQAQEMQKVVSQFTIDFSGKSGNDPNSLGTNHTTGSHFGNGTSHGNRHGNGNGNAKDSNKSDHVHAHRFSHQPVG